MAINFTTTAEAAVANGVKVLIYGAAGMGKTLLNATAPTPLLISAESGLLSLSRANIEKVYGADDAAICYDIPVMEITTVEDLMDAYQWCTEAHEAKQFETISLDSISEIGEAVLANAKKICKDPRQAYGELIEKMLHTVKSFRDISTHNIYFSAKMEMVKDEVNMTNKFGPSMPGSKLGPQLPFLFDEVFHLGIGQTLDADKTKYRYLRTQPDLQYDAKDRSGFLDEIEMPHLGHVFTKVKGL